LEEDKLIPSFPHHAIKKSTPYLDIECKNERTE